MQQNKPIVWFRADGSATIGLGHVVRSLALAELLAVHFECRFLIRSPSENLKAQILSVCSNLVELDDTAEILQEAQNLVEQHFKADDLVVLDGYHFTTDYQQVIKTKGCKLVCIDDIYAYPFLADAIINHAGGIYPSHYQALRETKFYLGLQYALLRTPFRNAATQRQQHFYNWQNIFICLGGADPHNETLKVLETVTKYPSFDTYFVVVGSAYLHLEALMAFIQSSSSRIVLRQSLHAEEMVNQMQQCATAICSPSTIAFEYLSVGGLLYLHLTADNQKDVVAYFLSSGLAFPFAQFPVEEKEAIAHSLSLQPKYFDGKQDKRLQNIFHDLLLDFRAAVDTDCDLYFEWANDPDTRAQSFSNEPIPHSTHVQWFHKKLKQTNVLLWVANYHGWAVGQIRFDLNGQEAIISFSLDAAFRGRGLGYLVLEKAVAKFHQLYPDFKVIGYVKISNIASNKVFQRLGFAMALAEQYEAAYRYEKFAESKSELQVVQ